MTDKERFAAIVNAVLTVRRENLRTLARLKALETVVRESLPESERDDWHKRVNRYESHIHQDLLESFEAEHPDFADQLDDRSDEELRDLT